MWGNRMSRENELMSRVGASGPAQRDWAVIIGLSLGALVFHLLVNTFGGYGIFRDEYYYIACSKRLAAGYVDQPPLAMFLLAASRAVFGLSELGLRVLPALAHGLTVLLAGLIARNLGGRRTAVMLTCVAVSLTPLIVGHTNIFQMNAFAHLEFIRNATAGEYSELTRLDFLVGQVKEMNPLNMLLWGPGLFFLLFNREGRRYRVLGIIYVAALAILLANPHSKSEYLGPAYVMLFAAGGVAVEGWAGRGKRGWTAPAVAALSVISSLLILPFAVPILPIKTFIRYSAAIGIKPSTSERKKLSELPQFYADMFGWEALAEDVSAVYLSLPEVERASAVVFAGNYGEAASLEYYSGKYALPRIISTHNSYWFWGYPKEGIRTVIVLRGKEEDHRKSCDEVTLAAVHTCHYCMPYENNMPIYVCRGLRVSPAEIWKNQRSFN